MGCRAIVITLGPPHDHPWWWDQVGDATAPGDLQYERISIGRRKSPQIGVLQLPVLLPRIWRILRRAKRERVGYLFTFEADLSCFLIGVLQRWSIFAGPKHVILQYITGEPGARWLGRLRIAVIRFALRSVWLLTCSSSREAEYYRATFGWPAGKVAFVPILFDSAMLELDASEAEPAYMIAAGRTQRDYGVLAAAVAGTGIATEIVCGARGLGSLEVPAEVAVVRELPFDALMRRMSGARIVVLPLEPRRISTGQSVLLLAMALGKAVIATRTAGTEDYVEDRIDGVLVPAREAAALRRAILELWADRGLRDRLGAAAKAAVSERFSARQYARAIRRAIETAAARAS